MKALLVLLSSFVAATAFAQVEAPVIGTPSTKEKYTCYSVVASKVAQTDAQPTELVTEISGTRSFWSANETTYGSSQATVTSKRGHGGSVLAAYTYISERKTVLEQSPNGFQIERNSIKMTTRTQDGATRESTYSTVEHFRMEGSRRVTLRMYRDGLEIPSRVTNQFVHTLADGRRLEVTIENPYTYTDDAGMTYEVTRSETSCLYEGI